MTIDKKQAAEFVRLYGINEYSIECLTKVFEDLGFNVISTESEAETFFGENYNTDSISFVINNAQCRVVYVDNSMSDGAICYTLCKLLHLRNSKDSRLCTQEELMNAEAFAIYVRDIITSNFREQKITSLTAKFGLYGITAIISILSLVTAIFAYFTSLNFVNAFEDNSIVFKTVSVNDVPVASAPVNIVTEPTKDDLLTVTLITENDEEKDVPVLEDIPVAVDIPDSNEETINETYDVKVDDTVKTVGPTETKIPDQPVPETEAISESTSTVVSTQHQSIEIPISSEHETETSTANTNVTQTEESNADSEQVNSGNVYYATKSGTKYHTANCQYVKDKSKCIQLTEHDIVASSKYEPCKKCL